MANLLPPASLDWLTDIKEQPQERGYPRHRNYFETDHRQQGKAKTVQLPDANEGQCLRDLRGHEGQKGTSWRDGNVLYPDLGDSHLCVRICQNSWNDTLETCACYHV